MAEQLDTISQLPPYAKYRFDAQSSLSGVAKNDLHIRKTSTRILVSLNFSTFRAKEIIREKREKSKISIHRSSELARIVPPGARYTYDFITFVGTQTYLEGRTLKEIEKELVNRHVGTRIPFSSLYDAQRKFLFYFGALHYNAAPRIREYLQDCGRITWLIDGTLEAGTPVFFGIKEANDGIFLSSWKIPTENEKDISHCLTKTSEYFSEPEEVLHDLSERMAKSCEIAFPNKAHRVCHYHFASDVGQDLYHSPQEMLSKRLRQTKLRLHLKDQRSRQTQWLSKAVHEMNMPLTLNDLLSEIEVTLPWNEALGREVLLALQLWMLDYPRDGHRQGFPFDPYLLYFHRRVVTVYEASERLLSRDSVRQKAPKVFFNLSDQLKRYLTDPIVAEASALYEKAYRIFEQLRSTLRIWAKGSSPMHESYELHPHEQKDAQESLNDLRKQFDVESRACTDPKEQDFYDITLTHLDKYAPYLFPAQASQGQEEIFVRTTNDIEKEWGTRKRIRRKTHGRRKLTRDFNALPEEYMLVSNLKNPRYVEIVLGSFDHLPEKLAEAGKTAGPYSQWYKRKDPLSIGRVPVHLLRKENFINNLIDIYNIQCQ